MMSELALSPRSHHAAGKAILLGEHFVVYGVSSLAVALPSAVQISSQAASAWVLEIPQWSLSLPPDSKGSELERAFHALLSALPESRPLRLSASLRLPSGVGLGSSASLGVAVMRAVMAANSWDLSTAEQYEALFHWESIFHGTPSGFDHASVLHEGLTLFRRFDSPPFQSLPLARDLHLLLAQIGPSASTKVMVDGVRAWRDAHPTVFAQLLKEADARTEAFIDGLSNGTLYDLGELLQSNQRALQKIGVSTPALDAACAKAISAGAYGSKLIGAGGGGCILALCDADRLPKVQSSLQDLAALTIPLHLPASI